ncbi:MAG: hypothetical protein ABIU95_16405 [Burkholderiales bacterium]
MNIRLRLFAVALAVDASLFAYGARAENDDPILAETSQEKGTDAKPFKWTNGIYRFAPSRGGGGNASYGYDTNLRHHSTIGSVWAGLYHGQDSASAWRLGWDRAFDLGWPRITPSVQLAQGGFIGSSILLEAGEPWFVATGLGRTNLRPYVNLNFDPNDAITYAVGRRLESGEVLALQMIRDNRQNPGDRHIHLYWRQPTGGKDRLTVDVLFKQGTVNDERFRRIGLALTYDWPIITLRIAWDPKVNFTPENQVRASIGWRL